MNVSPASFVQQVEKARKANAVPFGGDVLAYRSQTGVVRTVREHRHVMDVVEADLPGDRSIGYCHCGEYMDTGTWDERNA